MLKDFGEILTSLQIEHNLSNLDIAKILDIYPQNVPRLKRTRKPRISTIHKLVKGLDLDARDFFENN